MSGEQIQKLLDKARPRFESTSDALAFLLHCTFLDSGCKLVGLQESGDLKLDMGPKPDGWNASGPDLYTFRYISPAPASDVIVVKMISMDTAFVIHAAKRGESTLHSITLNTSDYCTSSTVKNPSPPSSCFKNLSNLVALCKNKIVDKFATPSKTFSKTGAIDDWKDSERRSDEPNRNPLRVGGGGHRPPVYRDPGRGELGGVPMPGFPGGDFGGDLDPLGGNGGSMMGPGQFPRVPGQLGPGPFMPRGFMPRHDPFGPGAPGPDIGPPGGPRIPGRRGDPDPDHLPPPGGPPDFL